MVGEDIINEILEYLKKAGPTNTFRLASVMDVDRAKLLSLLKKLEERGALEFERGNAIFIKFISGEKPKSVEIKEASPPSESKVKRKPVKPKALQLLQTENTQLQGKLLELKATVKELEQKAHARPKTITRTVTKTIIKKVPVTKTIIRKVPIVKTVVKRIHVPSSSSPQKEEKKTEKESIIKLKFKLPTFQLPKFIFMKNIKKLKKPEFTK